MRNFIEDILERKERESERLEFKAYVFNGGKFSSLPQKESDKFLKEICAFANTFGGTIVLGICEDDNHNPSDIVDTQVTEELFEEWEASFRNTIANRTIPVLYGIKLEHLVVKDKNCIVVKIPRSALGPHAFDNGSRDEFCKRNGNTITPMRYNDLKQAFVDSDRLQKRILSFRDERLAMILSGEIDESMMDQTALVIHIFPENALSEEASIDLERAKKSSALLPLIPEGTESVDKALYNADGVMKYNRGLQDEPSIISYIQLFSNGSIESYDFHLMNYKVSNMETGCIYFWRDIEKIIASKIYSYCSTLADLGLGDAYFISCTLLNTNGKKAIIDKDFGFLSNPISPNIVKSLFVKYSVNEVYPSAIEPILNKLARTVGWKLSSLYNDDGSPRPSDFPFLSSDDPDNAPEAR
ncbi:AlbA family DNA-binding domain-containing protein [Murdochiella massiliensis]|uniref:AlbA family DNA-binding domain-containing protein n=1 Tax=Murdochiella massiliensis TaxID=1673723 RepID=UPI000829AB1D|nr:ATP-binding protein [Murdochiella massiliensis]